MSTLSDVVRIGAESNVLGRVQQPKRLRASARPTPRAVSTRTGFCWVRHERFAPFASTWKRRYLVLDFDRRILTIYREDKTTFINFLDLRRCNLAAVSRPGAERRGAFTIAAPLSTRTIAAEDEEVSKAWLAELMRATAGSSVQPAEAHTASARRARRDMSRAQRRERAALLVQARFRLHMRRRRQRFAAKNLADASAAGREPVTPEPLAPAEAKLAARQARRRLAARAELDDGTTAADAVRRMQQADEPDYDAEAAPRRPRKDVVTIVG